MTPPATLKIPDGTDITSTKPARRKRAPKRAGKAPAVRVVKPGAKPTSSTSLDLLEVGKVHPVPCVLIDPCPWQPRQVFEPNALELLGLSIKKHGQQQNGTGRVVDGRVQLIAGERRLRACKLAGVRDYLVKIVEATDAEAVELAGGENLEREQLNAIEKATHYQAMIDVAGHTQQQVAERYKVSQPTVAQHLALLKLPEVWRQRVITGVIPATWARELVAVAEHPGVLDACEDEWKDLRESDPIDSPREFKELIHEAVGRVSRDLGESWRVHFKMTPKRRKELSPVTIKTPWGGSETVTFNVARFDELNAEAAARHAAGGKPKPAKTSGGKADPAADAARAKKILARRLWASRCRWLADQCRQQLDANPVTAHGVGLRLFITLAGNPGRRASTHHTIAEAVRSLGSKGRGGDLHRVDLFATLTHANETRAAENHEATIASVIRETVRSALLDDPTDYGAAFTAEQVAAAADLLGVKMADDWKLDDDFLQLHTKPQLLALAKEWKHTPQSEKRGDLIAELLRDCADAPAPKSLLKAKAPR